MAIVNIATILGIVNPWARLSMFTIPDVSSILMMDIFSGVGTQIMIINALKWMQTKAILCEPWYLNKELRHLEQALQANGYSVGAVSYTHLDVYKRQEHTK